MSRKTADSTVPARPSEPVTDDRQDATGDASETVPEVGGRKGPDPTRYGDWEIGGRCIDF